MPDDNKSSADAGTVIAPVEAETLILYGVSSLMIPSKKLNSISSAYVIVGSWIVKLSFLYIVSGKKSKVEKSGNESLVEHEKPGTTEFVELKDQELIIESLMIVSR